MSLFISPMRPFEYDAKKDINSGVLKLKFAKKAFTESGASFQASGVLFLQSLYAWQDCIKRHSARKSWWIEEKYFSGTVKNLKSWWRGSRFSAKQSNQDKKIYHALQSINQNQKVFIGWQQFPTAQQGTHGKASYNIGYYKEDRRENQRKARRRAADLGSTMSANGTFRHSRSSQRQALACLCRAIDGFWWRKQLEGNQLSSTIVLSRAVRWTMKLAELAMFAVPRTTT